MTMLGNSNKTHAHRRAHTRMRTRSLGVTTSQITYVDAFHRGHSGPVQPILLHTVWNRTYTDRMPTVYTLMSRHRKFSVWGICCGRVKQLQSNESLIKQNIAFP